MSLLSYLPFAAAGLATLVAVASLLRGRRSFATWCFAAGMLALSADSALTGLAIRATTVAGLTGLLGWATAAKGSAAVAWIAFSLSYARAEYRQALVRWKAALLTFGLLPLALVLFFRGQLFSLQAIDARNAVVILGSVARMINVLLLVAAVLVLTNAEQTFRSAVGTARWRIKYVVLGLVVIFGTRIYAQSQAVLFAAPGPGTSVAEAGAIVIGCVMFAVAYGRSGFAGVDLYPSTTALRSSVTLLLVGGYLFVVGVLAQMAGRIGSSEAFQLQSLIVLAGMAMLAVLLLSDRLRQALSTMVGRHFGRSQHDSTRIWTLFSQKLADVSDQANLAAVAARLIAETFDILSVSIWVLSDSNDRLVLLASTARPTGDSANAADVEAKADAIVQGLAQRDAPFELEGVQGEWANELRRLNPASFTGGGSRWCVPLRNGEACLGVVVLGDRVGAARFTQEELDLLVCGAAQIGSVLHNLRLGVEVVRAKELEAFQTMSAFFVHDLKNATASLNLMLKTMPLHFDDPAFRADALKAIGNTSRRIEGMLARLSAFRSKDGPRVPTDLTQLVRETLDSTAVDGVTVTRTLDPTPLVLADRDQLRSVVTNLVGNARDAVTRDGRIEIRTMHRQDQAVLSVADDGCGMSAEFMKQSLFRPFQSTKKQGLGIGLFQVQAIVRAHGGTLHVESQPGQGTRFEISLPVVNP